MSIHDWTRVEAGIFRDFHHEWISTIKRALNAGLLPPDFYALAEQIADGLGWKTIAVRHSSNHEVVAMVEIVSPGNKNRRHGLRPFIDKAVEILQSGIHLLVIDLFPPGSRDPEGIVKAIWDEIDDNDFALPQDKRLTVSTFVGSSCPEVFVEALAVGEALPEMPLFHSPQRYVSVPLDTTYQAAWEAVPACWREVLET